MVEPDQTSTTPRTAIRKLKTHYRKYGFENDPDEPELTEYMISTVGQIKDKIRYHIPRFNQRFTNRVKKPSRSSRSSRIPVRTTRKRSNS